MEIGPDLQSQECFLTEEVLAVFLKMTGKSWRNSLDYINLPSHLKDISTIILPLVRRAIIVSVRYNDSIELKFDRIRSVLDELPEAKRSECVFNSLIDAAWDVFCNEDKKKNLAFIGLVAALCGYLVDTNQVNLIHPATKALRFVLSMGHPGGLISTVRQLLD